jgi:plastocyanin
MIITIGNYTQLDIQLRGKVRMKSIIFVLVLPILILLILPVSALIQENENKVVIPFGAHSPVCERTLQCYVPNNIMIEKGDKVIWTNGDYAPHTVTSGNLWSGKNGLFESKILNHLDKFEFIFSDFKPGIYPYYCIIHPWMKGQVTVGEYYYFMTNRDK